MQNVARVDREVADAIRNETRRQGAQLELIASENFVSEAVLEAMGTVFTNKYAEGYPGKRYYGGCEFADVVENLAIARAKELFGCDHANVQPHSGTQANTAVYMSVLKPGDTILGMNLSHGGHLSHGHPLNFSGRFYNVVAYGVRKEDERLDYEPMAALAAEHRPKVIVVGASAYPRTIDFVAVRKAADACGAVVLADIAHIAGLVAAGIHPSPVPARRVRLHHHPQDPARAARRDGDVPGRVPEGARPHHLPRHPGRAAGARHRGQGGVLQGGARPRVQGLPAPGRGQRQGAGGHAVRRGMAAGVRRHRQPPHAHRRLLPRHHGQGGGEGARARRHHGEQEHHPLRHELADGGLGHPHRHAGAHHPRDEGSGDARRWGA